MNPLIPILAMYGIDAVLKIISTWRQAGEPTDEEIRALKIDKKPEDYFKDRIEE